MPRPSPKLTDVFFAALPESLHQYRTNDATEILRVPANAAEVGDLVVHNEGAEFTVAVGKIGHAHFECYLAKGEREEDRQRQAAEHAIEWIEQILSDQIRFRVEYSGGRVVAGSTWNPTETDSGACLARTDQVREYLWSGEQPASRPVAG